MERPRLTIKGDVMSNEEIEAHNETLAAFLEAVEAGGPVSHDIAAAAWAAWVAIDTEVTETLQNMDQTIADLKTALYFERLPGVGTA